MYKYLDLVNVMGYDYHGRQVEAEQEEDVTPISLTLNEQGNGTRGQATMLH